MTLRDIFVRVKNALVVSDDLRRKEYRGNPNLYAGHCYVASEAIFHLAKEVGISLKPMFVSHQGGPHWYLEGSEGIIDPTKEQFSKTVDYSRGRGKGFLTKQPSKRAKELIRRSQIPQN